jgi:hypothetical protein
VAGELLEPGDVNALRDAARNRPAPKTVAGKGRTIEPGEPGPFLDAQVTRQTLTRYRSSSLGAATQALVVLARLLARQAAGEAFRNARSGTSRMTDPAR